MLEKVLFCDAHFHFSQCLQKNSFSFSEETFGCSSCHSESDISDVPENGILSYGVHPQNPDPALLSPLESYLELSKINAIGECGFDFFSENFKSLKNEQKKVFESQLEIALKKNIPLVIHCRKANDVLFTYSKELSRLPSVLFHSFMGSLIEAESFLRRGINGYFSFGKQIFNNNKKVIELVSSLPEEKLLLETDAPYQTLKGESATENIEIKKIYEGAFRLRNSCFDDEKFLHFTEALKKNFSEMYRL